VSRSAPTEQDIAALFDRWNQSLQTGDPQKVVANYAERSILLPTVSNKPRLTPAEKVDYFRDCSMVAENNEPRRRARLQEKAGFLGNCQ
jgi:hypothetical protein